MRICEYLQADRILDRVAVPSKRDSRCSTSSALLSQARTGKQRHAFTIARLLEPEGLPEAA
jgi:hypothetical protein